ncbi:PIN domain-containing protein [Leptotrichia sp. oral taxon 223]|uniref:PIN domain-containing protein n=1 Tax=Leptotrichia sp. oral taxon 223 TaxID=712363 RepID=UPI0015BF4EB7|nr:PIN domain-containing protein [Leptotrichia sp. oral taxon 223]NWO18238.1 PIN domain-containing protein [Leptotrichia sp. oral taxon 223]
MVRKIKSMKRKKFKGKTYLFLDTNFLRNYKSNEENFKKSLSRLSSNYEIYVSSLTAIELKNNKTRDGIETLKLLKHVKVLPTEMEMISRQDSINYFSVNELLKTDNSEKYIKLKKYIELKNILYIFSVIQSIIEKKIIKKLIL